MLLKSHLNQQNKISVKESREQLQKVCEMYINSEQFL